MTDEEQEALNTKIAADLGIELLAAEIWLTLGQCMAYDLEGLMVFHGRPLNPPTILRCLAMKQMGFKLTERKMEQHAAYLSIAGIIENTKHGDELAEEAMSPRIEDN